LNGGCTPSCCCCFFAAAAAAAATTQVWPASSRDDLAGVLALHPAAAAAASLLLLLLLLPHRYGLPAAAMISLEWWAYEVILILAGELVKALQALQRCLAMAVAMHAFQAHSSKAATS
jgi:hypothetical protein